MGEKPGRIKQVGITRNVPSRARLLESKGRGEESTWSGTEESGQGQIIQGPMCQIKELSVS